MKLTSIKKVIESYKYEVLVVLSFLILSLFIPRVTFDWGSYVVWAQYIREHGLNHIYQLHYVNYMPLNIFAIHLWQLLVGKLGHNLVEVVHWVKLYPMIFDCLTVLLVLQMARWFQLSKGRAVAMYMLNVGFHYNSFIWGQFDSVYTFFVLLSLMLILKGKYGLGAIAYVLAMNTKLQAVIFFPLLLVAAGLRLCQSKERPTLQMITRSGITVLCLLGVQWLLFIPFVPYSAREILTVVWQRSSALSSYVTFNADNFWLLVGAKSMVTQDAATWLLGLPYKVWGYALFFVTSSIVLSPFVWLIYRALRVKGRAAPTLSDKSQLELSVLAGYLISLQFFFFLTQMHERYVHPVVLFAALYVLLQKKVGLLILVSVAYVINMERLLQFWWFTPRAQEYVALDKLAAILFALAWAYGCWILVVEVRRIKLMRA